VSINSLSGEKSTRIGYRHSDYQTRRKILRFLLKYIGFTLLARFRSTESMENFPATGPALLMINHIAFIDPILVLHVVPRNIVPLAKIEVYDEPYFGIFPRIWGVIPVKRDELDRNAVRQVLEVLDAGEIVLVAPEGTRAPQLGEAKEGIAYLGSRSGAPIVPVAVDGTEGFPMLRPFGAWNTPGATVKFGRPFRYRAEYTRAGRDMLRLMTDEAMYVLAAMLPENRRGIYSDLSKATTQTIEWV
jgi:1-acyl-sn-glycerol-3-phosphate acyltransferase